ncbi:MAG TPA: class I SAM-dependent methyltransferase [Pseudogracilibacillus sp.]|nr:class I SAM-dependent methyltransferase [Pseudogracilibacillus sp.]
MKSNRNEVIKKRYNRISCVYNWMDKMIRDKWRKQLLSDLHGDILEVGIGTGANLPYYPNHVQLTGIDFSEGMLKHARKQMEHTPFPLTLHEMDAQEMSFEDNTFDFVVATCVYCSVPDPVQGMKEMRRVCKPGGKILLLEHMRSDNLIIGKAMDVINPIVVGTYGANINRRTMQNIKQSGLKIENEKHLLGSVMRRLSLSPNK